MYYLTAGNNWIIGTVSGTRDSGRSYDILTQGGRSLRRNRSHLKPQSHDIPMLNQYFYCRTATPSQSEIFCSGPAHSCKEKYTAHNNKNNCISLSGPAHPHKEKFTQSVLVIKHMGNTAYDSYIAETLITLRSTFKPRKQTRFESDPVTSVRHILARYSKETSPPKKTIDPLDPDLLIPIELPQASMGLCVQDLGEIEAGEAYDTSKAHTPCPLPCGQIQVQKSDNSKCDSIAHCRTTTFSQSEIFSETSNSSSTKTGTETDIQEELHTPSTSDSEVTSSACSTEPSRITISSQSEISTETATEYDVSNEASSRETSRPSSPESGYLTAMHDAIHAVREQQRRDMTRKFFQQQQEVAASKLKCLSQIQKTSMPDPPPPKSNAFPKRSRTRLEMDQWYHQWQFRGKLL